ncbi:tyrosine-type recombinase/integrase [Rhodococcus erythropolis]
MPIDPERPDDGERQTGKAGFATAEEADDALTAAKNQLKNQIKFVRTSPTVATYVDQWIDGLQLEASTIAGFRRIAKNHIKPELGKLTLDKVTATRLASHYKQLLASGRKDSVGAGKPLSANSVNKVHVCLGAMFDAAKDDGYVAVNPARKRGVVKAPTGRQIKSQAPEQATWTAAQLTAFLIWNRDVFEDELYTLWRTVAMTGVRRSEALALEWRDIDLTNSRLSVRRALDTTARDTLKLTKTGGARVIDLDEGTIIALKAWRVQRGKVSLELTGAGAYVFGNLHGGTRSPNEVSRRWRLRVEKARAALGEDAIAAVTLKGLRHTHATLMLESGVHPKVVQERLGHSTITTTMNVYSHVTPTMQRDAVDRVAGLLGGN